MPQPDAARGWVVELHLLLPRHSPDSRPSLFRSNVNSSVLAWPATAACAAPGLQAMKKQAFRQIFGNRAQSSGYVSALPAFAAAPQTVGVGLETRLCKLASRYSPRTGISPRLLVHFALLTTVLFDSSSKPYARNSREAIDDEKNSPSFGSLDKSTGDEGRIGSAVD